MPITFPDVTLGLTDLFAPLVPTGHTGTSTTAVLAPPFIRVDRVGGPRDDVTDFGSYDIDAFVANGAGARAAAFTLLTSALDRLVAGALAGDVVIDSTTVTLGPVERPWSNTQVRRMSATVQVTVRRQ